MLSKTKGIVFRTVKFRESSLILDVYTRELGLKTLIINGVRKKKAHTSASILQVMSLLDLVIYDQENRDINRIKEVKSDHIYRHIPFDIRKSSVGMFMLEVSRNSIKEKEANPILFDFLEQSFQCLDETTNSISSFHISFLLNFSSILGFQPENNYSSDNTFFDLREGTFINKPPLHKDYIDSESSSFMPLFMKNSLESSHEIKLEKEQRMGLLEGLTKYFRIHLGDFGEIKSLEIFKEIFQG